MELMGLGDTSDFVRILEGLKEFFAGFDAGRRVWLIWKYTLEIFALVLEKIFFA